MILAAALTLSAGVLAAVSLIRDHRRASRDKAAILEGCIGLFDGASVTTAPDGFPRLTGLFAGRRAVLALVPDTMTIRRLPQLWLSITLASRAAAPTLSILARPRGNEFFCCTWRRRVTVPDWLPADSAVYGEDAEAEPTVAALRPVLEPAFGDARLKELTITGSALRAIYQLAEGERGAHLLLRQSRFTARLEPSACARLCTMLVALDEAAASIPVLAAA